MANKNKKYDIIVIGGGPAGMMAAISAAKDGSRVAILDKNDSLGRKLLMTGGGRCNFTQHGLSVKEFTSHYGDNGKFLFSSLSVFTPDDVVEFFRVRGVESGIESGRVFPASGVAGDILDVLRDELAKSAVDCHFRAIVKDVIVEDGCMDMVVLQDGTIFAADRFIICVGGMSYPSSGSAGDGYGWLRMMGHKVSTPRPALAPLRLNDGWITELSGISLPDVELVAKRGGKVVSTSRGEILFAHFGLTGPAAINLSAGTDLTGGNHSLFLDLFPSKNEDVLFDEWAAGFSVGKVRLRNHMHKILPQRFVDVFLSKMGIDGDMVVNSIGHKDIRRMIGEMKNCRLSLAGMFGFDRAMVTAGGADIGEIDPKTMRSKIVSNLYLAGEILDVTGETGGYNLQMCWSTGFVAGRSAAEGLKK